MNKYKNLIEYLKKLQSVAVGYSGGVDSSFLLAAATEALGKNNVIAITILAPYIMPKWEIEEARILTSKLAIKHIVIEMPILKSIRNNPENRCYICKKSLYSKMLEEAMNHDIKYVIDGTNKDDMMEYRPGLKALEELNVKRPLKENDLTKAEIRALSKNIDLHTWDKPGDTCLATRFAFGTELTSEELIKVAEAEKYITGLGFQQVRVRTVGSTAKIEVMKEQVHLLEAQKAKVNDTLKKIGYEITIVDPDGYKTGSMNYVV
jgi:pyridinium-3,5-biscarboxylic acid mononucleotide sulfurtransferase